MNNQEAPMTRWNIDLSHSEMSFTVRHLMFTKVRGTFGAWKGFIDIDESDKTKSKASVEVEMQSIRTNDEKRDAHLKSADFFETEKFPKMSFVSTAIEVKDGQVKSITGDLTIKDVTKSVRFEVEDQGTGQDPWGGTRAGFSAKTKLVRQDFGLTWNVALEAGGFLVGDTVEVALEVQAVKEQAAAKSAA
jgi:polyisoprenoid-binding protein YceI